MLELPHTHSCFVCGESNPLGLNLRFHWDGKEVSSSFTPTDHHCGFRHTVHGGLLSTVLDELMAWVAIVELKTYSYCGDLQVRFLQPVPPGICYAVRGRLVSNLKNKILNVEAEIIHPTTGIVLCKSQGKYLPFKKEIDPSQLDLIGDLSILKSAQEGP